MTKEAITMSQKEVDRLQVIQRTLEIRGGQAVAARQLGLSVRQVKRLVQRYRRQGAAGVVSRRRGQRPPECPGASPAGPSRGGGPRAVPGFRAHLGA